MLVLLPLGVAAQSNFHVALQPTSLSLGEILVKSRSARNGGNSELIGGSELSRPVRDYSLSPASASLITETTVVSQFTVANSKIVQARNRTYTSS